MTEEFHGQSPGSGDQDLLPQALDLKNYLSERLKGQPKAINSVCAVYEDDLTLRGLDDDLEEYPGPVGVFLFLGPSGVGKTETARLLSEYFMGKKRSMIKISCAVFSQPHMIHTIIGAPHSYVGFETPPMLSQKYIDQKIKPSKTLVAISPEIASLSNEQDVLVDRIKSYQRGVAALAGKIKRDTSFAKFLKEYDSFLHKAWNEDEASFAELFQDSDARRRVFDILTSSAKNIVESDSRNRYATIATIFELYGGVRTNMEVLKDMEKELKKASHKLLDIRKKIKDKAVINVPVENESKTPSRIVILFDEIEKGNQTLHNLLLEIMEDGRVTLANGNITDLSNAIIILTSNVGAEKISKRRKNHVFGFTRPKETKLDEFDETRFNQLEKDIWKIAKAEMEKTFSSAFIGRIDDVVVFRPLSSNNLLEILDFHIERLQTSWSRYVDLKLEISSEVRNFIIRESLDHPEIGARLLRHKFKSFIKRPLGRLLARHRKLDKVTFSMQEGKVVPICE